MLFHSYAFLLVFLPATWLIYFGLNRFGLFRLAQAALIAASFVFYGFENWRLCLLLAFSILVNYLFHCLLLKGSLGSAPKRAILICGLLTNFSLLFYFKYLNFTLENLNRIPGLHFALRDIALPLGISFYTFQQVSFVIDSYQAGRGKQGIGKGAGGMKGKYHFLDYALFVSFFPQLVAGPIVLHGEMIPQFQDREKKRIHYANMMSGMEYLIWGLAKKVLLADTFGRMADVGLSPYSSLNSISAIAVILSYTLEIYFDFSGYCDMAMGLGRLFNIEIPLNFRSPYKAVNIADFWKRWHMTLTRFLTTYLYIPLGGNRRGMWITCRNIMIVFFLSGLWHGADWNFVAWGLLHGIMMVLYRLNQERVDRMPKWLTWGMTFFLVSLAWVFFGTTGLSHPFQLYRKALLGGGGGFMPEILEAVCAKNSILVLLGYWLGKVERGIFAQIMTGLWISGGLAICLWAPSTHEIIEKRCRKQGYFLGLTVLFFWSVLHLSEVSKFIYFNF